MLIVASIVTAILAVLTIEVLILGGWWMLALVLLVPALAVFAYGVFESNEVVERDEEGNRL